MTQSAFRYTQIRSRTASSTYTVVPLHASTSQRAAVQRGRYDAHQVPEYVGVYRATYEIIVSAFEVELHLYFALNSHWTKKRTHTSGTNDSSTVLGVRLGPVLEYFQYSEYVWVLWVPWVLWVRWVEGLRVTFQLHHRFDGQLLGNTGLFKLNSEFNTFCTRRDLSHFCQIYPHL